MKVLQSITPSPEQLKVIRTDPSLCIIRGAIGSGKTTTAILRLRFMLGKWRRRREASGIRDPVRVLVLTYNRTLRGYVGELVNNTLASGQDEGFTNFELTLSTAAKWLHTNFRIKGTLMGSNDMPSFVVNQVDALECEPTFLCDELDYTLGRFAPDELDAYLKCVRTGRGSYPKCDREFREKFLREVVGPYKASKEKRNLYDWHDLAAEAAQSKESIGYHIILCDEVQDFSANEVRAITHHADPGANITFVLDGAQRIYPRSFTWREIGLDLRPQNFHRLSTNYRNTREIVAFILPLLDGVDIGEEEGTCPDPSLCPRSGPKPVVILGRYSQQLGWLDEKFWPHTDLARDSVAFLKPLGGGWFDELRTYLGKRHIPFVELTSEPEWPSGPENVALCTMHSAKGLEFDHVVILGLNTEVTTHGNEPGDVQFEKLRRLFAMACGRARKTVTVGFKPESASKLVDLLEPTTYKKIVL